MEALDAPRFAAEGVMRESMIPMLQYYLKQIYHLYSIDIDFERNTRGWHRNCVLRVKKGTDTLLLPVKMDFTDANAITAQIGNFLQDMYTIEFQITYSDNRQLIVFESKDMGLVGENRIEIDHDKVKSITTISVNGKTIYYMDEELLHMDIGAKGAKFTNLPKHADIDVANSTIYQLPWGGYIVIRLVKNEDASTKRTDIDTIFIEGNDTKVAIRHYSYGLVENLKDGLKLRTDGAFMRKLYYGDKHGETETLFMPVGYYSGWDYKEYLENKYFYENTSYDADNEDMEDGR